ncbi:hypothetical protein DMI65_23870 [Escherichia coli]|nr:hypothetical protein [Escherichia coli]
MCSTHSINWLPTIFMTQWN